MCVCVCVCVVYRQNILKDTRKSYSHCISTIFYDGVVIENDIQVFFRVPRYPFS